MQAPQVPHAHLPISQGAPGPDFRTWDRTNPNLPSCPFYDNPRPQAEISQLDLGTRGITSVTEKAPFLHKPLYPKNKSSSMRITTPETTVSSPPN
jgi:hypothetical protein